MKDHPVVVGTNVFEHFEVSRPKQANEKEAKRKAEELDKGWPELLEYLCRSSAFGYFRKLDFDNE